jgi:hypothetical protein
VAPGEANRGEGGHEQQQASGFRDFLHRHAIALNERLNEWLIAIARPSGQIGARTAEGRRRK